MNIEDVMKDVKSDGWFGEAITFRLTHVPTGIVVERNNVRLDQFEAACNDALGELAIKATTIKREMIEDEFYQKDFPALKNKEPS